jgi:hypothetical protein
MLAENCWRRAKSMISARIDRGKKMATARQHLATTHHKEQSHWNGFAEGLSELGAHVRALHKEAGMKGDCKAGDAIDKLVAAAQSHADYHGSQVEACMKATDDDLNKLVPTAVSGVAPPRPNITPVLRTGAPPMQSGVDPQLAKIVGGLREEDWNTDEPSLH